MKIKKIKVDAVISFSDGSRQRKEFDFDKLGQISETSLIKYIMINTPKCTNVVIIDVWHEIETE
jgi:hypothetical protein